MSQIESTRMTFKSSLVLAFFCKCRYETSRLCVAAARKSEALGSRVSSFVGVHVYSTECTPPESGHKCLATRCFFFSASDAQCDGVLPFRVFDHGKCTGEKWIRGGGGMTRKPGEM